MVQPLSDVSAPAPAQAYDDLLFISANAVRYGLRALFGEQVLWPPGCRCFAVGERTADALRVCGARVLTPGDDMRSEALLALPELHSMAGRRVLLVRGEGGRDLLRDALCARGARVDELVCYRRSPVAVDPPALGSLLQREHIRVILISSGEAMGHLSALLKSQENTNLALDEVTVIVPSERVAALARSAGWRAIQVAANASDDAMLAALQTLAVRGKSGE
jgi:uroporphyrinogen-III synthase